MKNRVAQDPAVRGKWAGANRHGGDGDGHQAQHRSRRLARPGARVRRGRSPVQLGLGHGGGSNGSQRTASIGGRQRDIVAIKHRGTDRLAGATAGLVVAHQEPDRHTHGHDDGHPLLNLADAALNLVGEGVT